MHLHVMIIAYEIVLFVDSLDQLSDKDRARSDISFLKNIRPHRNSAIIVSCLPDERHPGLQFRNIVLRIPHLSKFFKYSYSDKSGWKYFYGCDTKLGASEVPRMNVLPWDVAGAREVLETVLRNKNRTLSPTQWGYVMDQVKEEPTALYVHLAVRVLEHWTSNQSNAVLEGRVKNLIMQILNSLECNDGTVFVRAAFGFITYSVDGLTDGELMDLLTMHKVVMSSCGINEFNKAVRLPSHVWLRLRGEVYGLLMEREGWRLGWFHRQLKEAAEERYKDEKQYLHEVMSIYFGGLISHEDETLRGISLQALTLNCPIEDIWSPKAVINQRRCVEAGHHMLAAGWYEEAEKELCTVEAVYTRAKCGAFIILLC